MTPAERKTMVEMAELVLSGQAWKWHGSEGELMCALAATVVDLVTPTYRPPRYGVASATSRESPRDNPVLGDDQRGVARAYSRSIGKGTGRVQSAS